ncbi:hypothetical protein BXZ70DRAFT_8649 [Cristinia sonorae]|uniref:Uncharacterized protein n=1 Tax=Cristinia sonorae TaxID=1940300 RepID=A0A8K0UY04_9AGAR|nr:hypothetical protein BXZ70DRAFT_8649 [Cristinia sonorae]
MDPLTAASTAIGVAANTLTAVSTLEALVKVVLAALRLKCLHKDTPKVNLLIGQRFMGSAHGYILEAQGDIEPDDMANFYEKLNMMHRHEDRLKAAIREVESTGIVSMKRIRLYKSADASHNAQTRFKNTSKDAKALAAMRARGMTPYACQGETWSIAASSSSSLGPVVASRRPESSPGPAASHSDIDLNAVDEATLCEALEELEAGNDLDDGFDVESLSSALSVINPRWETVLSLTQQ